ncbi:alpha-L-glutamate ligase-like protein [Legionella jordanis]|uniref:Glutathione synthase/ribosomal protein S6 modification enzyme n=1 Tax=Legionella jordanis TaxID=456 RepID=A0A0W0VD29_9GAMM|nr:alpha-L-glutamate ligase-like protein [Legionella jordanis]KTD17994.1 glutathione synthase/ribosomal protein S6 modification enzyme [Legionella jordanis]RMX02316.1 alpha-L-glutamate ligase-like protein [Legionella jordanis]RMX21199.1 alpha-L-glutamate ligase-like protein [Legionella jordanis]VEH13914.1 glutathione synthase/ribosomal protein S6 modification enzyme [Legionella jordanis]HAT8714294.1 alpha-L-glutamate ligase-like protein [Legionella jordanis]
MLQLYRRLRKRGVLSINQRNSDYVLRYNPRKLYPLVDDKLQTKKLAVQAGIAVPKLYEIIDSEHQIRNLDAILSPYKDFVIKPAHGAGGDGIIVITDRVFGRYRQINGKLFSTQELSYHLSSLLTGAYSLGGHNDYAIIEHRVVVDPVFKEVSYEGIPDIRIITLLGYPAMAMARLPTRLSGGKANLHQGAIGVGINLATGKTLGGVFHNDAIDYHPDTLAPIVDITVPYWDKILEIAASCYELTGLGYLGVDIVLDRDHGPLMLELNARPGLNIQIANREGGLKRYRKIEAQAAKEKQPIAARIAYSKEEFA